MGYMTDAGVYFGVIMNLSLAFLHNTMNPLIWHLFCFSHHTSFSLGRNSIAYSLKSEIEESCIKNAKLNGIR